MAIAHELHELAGGAGRRAWLTSGVATSSAHFSRLELECPHCRECFIRPRLLQLLEKLRTAHGGPLRLASGYRCPVHNRQAGGASDSQHVYGAAADLALGQINPQQAIRAGATGIGTQGAWVRHVDVRDGGLKHWTYPV